MGWFIAIAIAIALAISFPILWFVYIILAILFFVWSANEDKKEAQREAEKKEKEFFNTWSKKIDDTITNIVDTQVRDAKLNETKQRIDELFNLETEGKQHESELDNNNYSEYFQRALTSLEKRMRERLRITVDWCLNDRGLSHEYGLPTIYTAFAAINQLITASEGRFKGNQSEINDALQIITNSANLANSVTKILSLDDYGLATFTSPNPWDISESEALKLYQSLEDRETVINQIAVDYSAAAQALDESFICDSARLMWFNAMKSPLNIHDFDDARRRYNAFTQWARNNNPFNGYNRYGDVEELLARLYASNKMGGLAIVKQEEPYVQGWIELRLARNELNQCFALASGLAWLELYDLEKTLLNTLVAKKVQLPAELQERLSFLQSGRTKNIRLFEVEPGTSFAYDSSAADWKSDEFAVFFRKLAMKKMPMNYSLALDNWTKAIPLRSGQQVSNDEIYDELQRMVRDFDGEVTCEKIDAFAVDLENVRYEDATLFRFTSERSRCVTVLFSSEKYGRNLNVTVITLFTPETGMEPNVLERYAIAAKSNMYMESFRESILQALDDVLKIEKSIYGDDESSAFSSTSRNIID